MNTESGLFDGLNTTANITMYSLSGFGNNSPNLLENGQACTGCEVLSWDNDTGLLVFNVSHFSNYTASNAGSYEGEGEEETPAGVPEFSDYAIMLLLVLAVGGFVVMRNREEWIWNSLFNFL